MPAITINKTRYTLQFLPPSKMPKDLRGKPLCGNCDPPDRKNPKVRINKGLSELDTLDTIIHELQHAAAFCLCEPWIETGSTHIAAVLDNLGVHQGGEWEESIRDTIYAMLRMCRLMVDEGSDGWAERTADEIAVVLKNLGYGV